MYMSMILVDSNHCHNDLESNLGLLSNVPNVDQLLPIVLYAKKSVKQLISSAEVYLLNLFIYL